MTDHTYSNVKIKEIQLDLTSNGPYLPSIMNAILKLKHENDTHLYFRGESQKYPYIIPSLYRTDNKNLVFRGSEDYYRCLMSELGRDDYNESSSLVRMMAEFRHFGAITRILDVSRNPLTSIYFAVENNNEKDGYVYIFSSNDEKYDTGHTIAIKTALNLIPQSRINDFINCCERLISLYNSSNDIEVFGSHKYKSDEKEDKIWAFPRMKDYEIINKWDEFSAHFKNDRTREEEKRYFVNMTKHIEAFMELLNQRARVRERLSFPFKIYKDLCITHLFISSMNTDRIKRQRGAFLFPSYVKTEENRKERALNDIQEQIQNSILECLYNGKKGNTIVIPSSIKADVKDELYQLGIDGGFLYSDIQHQSEALLSEYRRC